MYAYRDSYIDIFMCVSVCIHEWILCHGTMVSRQSFNDYFHKVPSKGCLIRMALLLSYCLYIYK